MNCKYFEICGLERWGQNETCILHWENNRECKTDFKQKLNNLINQGHANYQKVYFPDNDTTEFVNKTFNEVLVFNDAQLQSKLNLERCTLKKGLKANGISLDNIILARAIINGPVEISVLQEKQMYFQANEAQFKGKVFMKVARLGGVYISNAKLKDNLSIEAEALRNFRCAGAVLEGCLEIQNCRIGEIDELPHITFGINAEVNLCNSKIHHQSGLIIEGKTFPKILRINGLEVESGRATLSSPMTKNRMKIIAETVAPSFAWDKDVRLKNVDLSECCLVGNNLQNFRFTNIQWARWHPCGIDWLSRDVLKDEIVMREGNKKENFPIKNLRESYEILKKDYEKRGNMLQASYFHYGEIEMRRHAGGTRERFFSLDFLYWLLSGYGLGWGRALFWVVLLILVSTGIYRWDNLASSTYDGWDWLRHSFQVTTFQKPNLPNFEKSQYSSLTKWTQAVQSVLGPFLIALFGLAVRTRIKR